MLRVISILLEDFKPCRQHGPITLVYELLNHLSNNLMQKISESVRNCFDSFKFLPTFSTQLYSTLRIKEKKTQFERYEGFSPDKNKL